MLGQLVVAMIKAIGCEVCDETRIAMLDSAKMDSGEYVYLCKDRVQCDINHGWLEAPCCGIPHAPHPGCCDHTWVRCMGCGHAGPTYWDYDEPKALWQALQGKYYCPECYEVAEYELMKAECDLEQAHEVADEEDEHRADELEAMKQWHPCDVCSAPREACTTCVDHHHVLG